MKPTRCSNFSYLFLEWNSTCFGQFLCPSSGVFHCTHSSGKCHTGFADSLRAGSGGNYSSILILLASCQQNQYVLCVQWKTPDDGQRNSPKHVEFYSQNKFEKLVHLGSFITRTIFIKIYLNRSSIQTHIISG